MSQRTINIIHCKRSPISKYRNKSIPDIVSPVVTSIVQNLPFEIDELIVGSVLQSGHGQNIAKQIAIHSGLSLNVICSNVNKVCASSIKALDIGINSILSGKNNAVLIVGVEKMSDTPILDNDKNSLMVDGLTCGITKKVMGELADDITKRFQIEKDEIDKYAVESYQKWSQWKDKYKELIVPVDDIKEDYSFPFSLEKMKTLKTIFGENGVHTAATSSKVADGCAVALLVSDVYVKKYNLQPTATIETCDDVELEPEDFCIAPASCIVKSLQRINLKKNDISIFQINEAFAIVPILNSKLLGIPLEKVNPGGGAIAHGHPLGASGLVILCHLLFHLKKNEYGCLGICNGGGGASSLIVKKM